MKRAGLYRRHDVRCPTLAGFSTYLRLTLGVKRYRQEVENVARFLYFVNPHSTDLTWVRDIEKVHAFFTRLRDQLLTEQTVLNYLKGVRRFLRYQMRATNLPVQRPRLFKECQHLCSVLDDLQKFLSKGASREVVRKRYLGLDKSSATPEQCRRLLEVAMPNFLASVRAATGGSLTRSDALEILYFLQAVLILKHLQRPGVVKNLRVSEWKGRVRHEYGGQVYAVVGVQNHKTSTKQIASFALNGQEESWFSTYHDRVRPLLLAEQEPEEFFISTTSAELYNPSNDLRRYHHRYGLQSVPSVLVRKVCETSTVALCTDAEKSLFARYLSHSNMTAERVYREKTLDDICHGSELVIRAGRGERPQVSRGGRVPVAGDGPEVGGGGQERGTVAGRFLRIRLRRCDDPVVQQPERGLLRQRRRARRAPGGQDEALHLL